MSDFKLSAKLRQDAGKGASRRLRRLAGEVPAIVYGGSKEPANISLLHKDMIHELENEAFYTSVLTLDIDGSEEAVVLKDLQRHPSKAQIMHADFLRVDATKKLTMRVPLHFINEDSCKGVKEQGGIVTHGANELEVSCLAKDLPEFIEVDLADLELGQSLHISDLKLPAGVESVELSHGAEHDQSIATISAPRGGVQDEEAGEAEAESNGEEPAGE